MVSWRNRARNLDIPIGILMFLKCSGWPCPFYAPSMPLVCLLCPMYAPSMSTITHFQYFHQKSCKIPWSSMKSSSFQEIPRKFLEYAHFNGFMVSWRPRAGNLDIPIGILMFLRRSGPPRSHKKADWHWNSMNSIGFNGIWWTCAEFSGIPRDFTISQEV